MMMRFEPFAELDRVTQEVFNQRTPAVPVDAYGVGSSLFEGRFDFTADVVLLDGKPCAKVGRGYRPNPRLERVT